MQENNFEKEVQQKLQGLQLEPKPPVWDAVHARIQPERRRKIFIFWWLPLAVGMMLGGWWLATQKNVSNGAALETPAASTVSFTDKNASVKNKAAQIEGRSKPLEVKTESVSATEFEIRPQQSHPASSAERNKFIAPIKPNPPQAGEQKNEGLTETTTQGAAQQITVSAQKEKATSERTRINPGDAIHPTHNIPAADSPAVAIKSIANLNDSAKNVNSVPEGSATTTQKRVKKKGSFFVQAGVGISGSGTPAFSSAKSAEALVGGNSFSSPQTYFGPVSSPMSSMVPPVYRTGLAFNVGAGWQRPLSSRTSFGVGINYRYNSLHVQPGQRWGSARSVRNNGLQDVPSRAGNGYSSVYHFVEVPVQLKYQPFRKKDIWLFHGIGPAFAAAYKAVAFNNRTVDVQEVQWVATSGFNLGMNLSAHQKLYIGPSVRYHINPLLNNSNRHLTEAALLLTLPIRSKK